jgi:flagellar biosynthesis protein FliQ
MENDLILDLFRESIKVTMMLSLPVLLVGLIVGLLIAVFQATTQIQEQNLTFVPKLIATLVMLALISSWMGRVMIDYTMTIFNSFEKLMT